MSEKRLQEIKDSIEFQKEILEAHNMNTLCVDEEQELLEEIERLNKALLDIKEYIEKSYKEDYGNNENYIPIEHLNLKNCSYERSLVVLDIVNKALGSDKE